MCIRDREFDELMETYEDESAREALETYRADNPLHDAFYVEVNDGDALKDTAEKIQAIEGIETVNYGGDSALMFVPVSYTHLDVYKRQTYTDAAGCDPNPCRRLASAPAA